MVQNGNAGLGYDIVLATGLQDANHPEDVVLGTDTDGVHSQSMSFGFEKFGDDELKMSRPPRFVVSISESVFSAFEWKGSFEWGKRGCGKATRYRTPFRQIKRQGKDVGIKDSPLQQRHDFESDTILVLQPRIECAGGRSY